MTTNHHHSIADLTVGDAVIVRLNPHRYGYRFAGIVRIITADKERITIETIAGHRDSITAGTITTITAAIEVYADRPWDDLPAGRIIGYEPVKDIDTSRAIRLTRARRHSRETHAAAWVDALDHVDDSIAELLGTTEEADQ